MRYTRYLEFALNKVYGRYTMAPTYSEFRGAFVSRNTASFKYEEFVNEKGNTNYDTLDL